MQFQIASVDSLIITFSEQISLKISQKIKFYYEQLKKIDGIIEVIPSYTTIYIQYDIFKYDLQTIQKVIQTINYYETDEEIIGKKVVIPVWYDTQVGWDLPMISQAKKMSIEEIIHIHTSQTYMVYAIGFAPGFAYLGEVSSQIAMPRLKTPRKMVTKGSVAIADTQTAIYPQNSPGGWNIIGKTPIEMFDITQKSLCPVSMGDTVQFEAIDKQTFLKLGGVL